MQIRFLLHDVHGAGGGVLKVALNLAGELGRRHDVELVSVLRRVDEPMHTMPSGVAVRTLLDERARAPDPDPAGLLPETATKPPSRLILPEDPWYEQHSLDSDTQLLRYLRSVRGGVLIGMQPGLSVAIARFAPAEVLRVAQEHRPFSSRPKSLREASLRYYPRLDVFLTLTRRDARRYRRELGEDVSVGVMPNGAPAVRGPTSDLDSLVVVAAGRLERSKGFDRLLDAWAIVARRHPDWELRIFGEGGQRADLEEQIATLDLAGSARLMGYTTRLSEEMAAASLFVLSSRVEGYPMVMLEAMACGLPVVSFDCRTGPREIIRPGRDGFLVPDGDVEGLAAAINRTIEMGDGRRALGAAALRAARRRTQSAVAARWEQLLERRLAAKR